ncbi:hypothetical protein BD777DRAFT_27018, partial [Yarrowia lipolytica]
QPSSQESVVSYNFSSKFNLPTPKVELLSSQHPHRTGHLGRALNSTIPHTAPCHHTSAQSRLKISFRNRRRTKLCPRAPVWLAPSPHLTDSPATSRSAMSTESSLTVGPATIRPRLWPSAAPRRTTRRLFRLSLGIASSKLSPSSTMSTMPPMSCSSDGSEWAMLVSGHQPTMG